MKKFLFLAMSILVMLKAEAFNNPPPCPSFTMCGPTSVTQGQTATYTYIDDFSTSTFTFTVVGGTLQSKSVSNFTYTAVVKWTVAGAGSITFDLESATLAVTVTAPCTLPPIPTATFSYVNNIGSTVITETGTPPAGVTWYWQVSATGTDMSNSTATYTALANGTYYLRPYSSCGWGTAQATSPVTVTPCTTPPTPNATFTYVNNIGNTVITETGTPPPGFTWYWQVSPTYTDMRYSTATYTAIANGTYYLRAYSASCGWGAAQATNAVTITQPTGNLWTLAGSDIFNSNSGKVGIGTNDPANTTPLYEKLTVQGNVHLPLSNSIGYKPTVWSFQHNGNTVGDYALGWAWDSWQTGAPTGYLASSGGLKFFTGENLRMSIDAFGVIRWGNNGSMINTDQGGSIELRGAAATPYIDFSNNATQDYSVRMILSGNNMLNIDGGSVGIGTPVPDEKLTVKGRVHAQEIKIDLLGPCAPDYVFEKDYDLLSLDEVNTYIEKNKHLPEVPSAKEMEENGLKLGDMSLLLLKKVEELTLHLIQTNKRLEMLEKENAELKKKIN